MLIPSIKHKPSGGEDLDLYNPVLERIHDDLFCSPLYWQICCPFRNAKHCFSFLMGTRNPSKNCQHRQLTTHQSTTSPSCYWDDTHRHIDVIQPWFPKCNSQNLGSYAATAFRSTFRHHQWWKQQLFQCLSVKKPTHERLRKVERLFFFRLVFFCTQKIPLQEKGTDSGVNKILEDWIGYERVSKDVSKVDLPQGHIGVLWGAFLFTWN